MPRGKNYVNQHKGMTLQASQGAVVKELCFYGAGCERKDCIYRHDNTVNNSNEPPKSTEPCMAYLAGICTFQAKTCRKRHPGPEESEALRAKFAQIKCRFGDKCKTKGCLYIHDTTAAGTTATTITAVPTMRMYPAAGAGTVVGANSSSGGMINQMSRNGLLARYDRQPPPQPQSVLLQLDAFPPLSSGASSSNTTAAPLSHHNNYRDTESIPSLTNTTQPGPAAWSVPQSTTTTTPSSSSSSLWNRNSAGTAAATAVTHTGHHASTVRAAPLAVSMYPPPPSSVGHAVSWATPSLSSASSSSFHMTLPGAAQHLPQQPSSSSSSSSHIQDHSYFNGTSTTGTTQVAVPAATGSNSQAESLNIDAKEFVPSTFW